MTFWDPSGRLRAHKELVDHPRACPWGHGCLNVDGMGMVTPIIQVYTLLASHGWCNHTPKWSSPCQGSSLVPQNSIWKKLSYLKSQNSGRCPKSFCWVHGKFPTHLQRDSTIFWEYTSPRSKQTPWCGGCLEHSCIHGHPIYDHQTWLHATQEQCKALHVMHDNGWPPP